MFGLSFSSWKKSDSSASTGAAAGGSKKAGAVILLGVLGAGAIGYKMFWPESAPLKAAASTKTLPTSKGGNNSTPAKNNKPKPAVEKPNAPKNATPAKPVAKPIVKPQPVEPPETPEDSDVPPTGQVVETPPAPKPPKPQPQVPPAPKAEVLGPAFVDEVNGFSIRFPASWPVRTFAGEPWVLDCGDGKTALISIGFSPFPADFSADNIPPEWVARRIEKRKDTVLNAQGYAMIAGKKALWSKSTGPLPMTNGNPRMTRVNYIVPLGDGRVMEFRIATTPEIFQQMMPTMRASVESFKLIPGHHSPAR